MNEPIGCALCGGNDHNADECKRFAGEREAISEIRQRALELYEPPFQFHCGYIQDSKHRMVADQHDGPDSLRVRGWGRISYMEDPEKLQDEVGALIAEALTEKWTGTAPQPAPAQDVAGWIPVAERLPEVAQEVIVSTEFEGVCAGILDSYGEWFAPCSEYKLTRVTHWMPLPAAPEVV